MPCDFIKNWISEGSDSGERRSCSFSIGEALCEDTFVVHIEKAFADIDGAYPMINQQFVQHECTGYQVRESGGRYGFRGLEKGKVIISSGISGIEKKGDADENA